MSETIELTTDLTGVDWARLKAALIADDFDNGRTAEQLRRSFENSGVCVLAMVGGEVIGTVRALSDGVCNAYVVDVWTHSSYRLQGIGRGMMELLLEQLPGQHVYLFTDDAQEFYRKLGFHPDGTGLARVVGEWLQGASSTPLTSG